MPFPHPSAPPHAGRLHLESRPARELREHGGVDPHAHRVTKTLTTDAAPVIAWSKAAATSSRG